MNELRVVLAVSVFLLSSYFLIDMLLLGFSLNLLLAVIVGYTASHYIWPRQFATQSTWYELLEWIVELPFRALALIVRSIGKFGD